jgi:hypothetical protein
MFLSEDDPIRPLFSLLRISGRAKPGRTGGSKAESGSCAALLIELKAQIL